MSFLSPLFLLGAAAGIVPLLLHLLRRHTEYRVRFAAVTLLKGAPVEQSIERRLRRWLLLALRVAALLLLALAFARPLLRAAPVGGKTLTVIALDTSLSMSASAQWSIARERARAAIRSADGDIALLTFADNAAIDVPPTSSRSVASAGVDAATAGFGSTNYRSAFAVAADLFRGRTGQVIVVTDLQANGWDGGGRAALPDGVQVVLQDVGTVAENLAVTDLRPERDGVVATVANGGPLTKAAHVTLTVDGTLAGRATVDVRAHDTATATFTGIQAGVARADLDDQLGLQGDNARLAFVGGAMPMSLLVVTTSGELDTDAWYLRHAIAAAGSSKKSAAVTSVSTSQLGTWTDDRLSKFASVAVLSSHGLERRARERLATYVAGGGGLLIAAGPDVDGDVMSDVLGAGHALEIKAGGGGSPLSLAPADVRHPIFRPFGGDIASLTLVRFRSVARVTAPDCDTIARFTSGDAAVLDCAVGAGRALVVASDFNNRWNDFPIRASFVPFVDQAVRYLSNARTRGAEYVVGDIPSGVQPVPGVTTVAGAAGPRRVIVNVDPRESDLTRMSPTDFLASIDRLKESRANELQTELHERESRQPLWQYLIAAVSLTLFAEGVIAARAA
jgi:hypothetical protein